VALFKHQFTKKIGSYAIYHRLAVDSTSVSILPMILLVCSGFILYFPVLWLA